LETKPPSEADAKAFSKLAKKDWQAIRTMADKQGVSAIVFDGLNAVISSQGAERIVPDIDKNWWRQYILSWSALMMSVEQRNSQQKRVMNEMATEWTKRGCRVLVMKGQANAIFFPHPEHRSPGDIDCYLFEDYARGNDIAREIGAKVDESWYKHSVISYQGETFENHQFFVHTRDGKRGKLLEQELENALLVDDSWFFAEQSGRAERMVYGNVVFPPVQWTAMFLTYHACAHFVSEGLKLKQLVDWAMFLQKEQDNVDWPSFYDYCERHHLRRFADAATAICVDYLGLSITNPLITISSPYAERIVQSTLYDDDYVFGSGEGGWHNRWHIIKNLFRYRWKYEEIYQHSIYKQLWYYASGYLFKTE
jgi:hypothetical protein